MVIRLEQSANFEAIHPIMHGTPNLTRFTNSKLNKSDALNAEKSLDHYSAPHYSDVKMSAMASQIVGVLIVYSNVCSGVDQRKHQSSASLVCVRGIHRWPVNSPQSPVKPRTQASDVEHVYIWWRHHENRKHRCRRRVLLHDMWSECSPVETCFNETLNAKNLGESPHPPTLHSSF